MRPTNSYDSRLCGLDTLRAVAISVVLMDNYRWVTNKNIFGFMSQLGGAGVDLFLGLALACTLCFLTCCVRRWIHINLRCPIIAALALQPKSSFSL